MKYTNIFLAIIFCGLLNVSVVMAQNVSETVSSYQAQTATFSYDSIKEILNNLSSQKSQSDDMLLNVLLAVPVEKRQYVYPALHENKGMPKKILSHPEIAPFKGTKPTDLPLYLKEYVKEYLAYLPSAYYIYLDPDLWQEVQKEQLPEANTIFSSSIPILKTTPHKGEFYTFPSVESLYSLSDETQKNYKKTDLTTADISRMLNTMTALENYINTQEDPRKFKLSLVRIMMKNNNLNGDLSYPFASLVGRLKMVKPIQEIEKLFKDQGWTNATDFAQKADRILKAYRVNFLGVPQAIQLNKVRAYPASAPTTEVMENLRTYAKMHEAKPGDVYFVEPYLQDIRQKLKPDFIFMLGTPIYME